MNMVNVDKLTVDCTMKSWADGLRDARFQQWIKQIRIDFAGNEGGDGILYPFRRSVMATANEAVSKGNGTLKQCIDFILEECAYTCAFFKNVVMVYPTKLSLPIAFVIEHYKTNIRHLSYNMSNNAQRHKNRILDRNKINNEIIEFITTIASTVNFFVISKNGEFIYKNESLGKIVSELNAMSLNPETWENSLKAINLSRQVVVEEHDKGKVFLSVKSPLIIDDEIEGVIGLAVEITDRKKAQQLEIQSKLQEERKIIYDQIAHDIRSPLAALSMLARNCKGLSEKEHIALRNIATSIENITSDLLNQGFFLEA
ncbi:hypothetical protein FACS1894122_14330 [Alphaproteobacteria bacterium]|nr:hypothetical protein FACS1894122_14330 [Alphaproteobacteria bacterium]